MNSTRQHLQIGAYAKLTLPITIAFAMCVKACQKHDKITVICTVCTYILKMKNGLFFSLSHSQSVLFLHCWYACVLKWGKATKFVYAKINKTKQEKNLRDMHVHKYQSHNITNEAFSCWLYIQQLIIWFHSHYFSFSQSLNFFFTASTLPNVFTFDSI